MVPRRQSIRRDLSARHRAMSRSVLPRSRDRGRHGASPECWLAGRGAPQGRGCPTLQVTLDGRLAAKMQASPTFRRHCSRSPGSTSKTQEEASRRAEARSRERSMPRPLRPRATGRFPARQIAREGRVDDRIDGKARTSLRIGVDSSTVICLALRIEGELGELATAEQPVAAEARAETSARASRSEREARLLQHLVDDVANVRGSSSA